jgi:hypothetical protein
MYILVYGHMDQHLSWLQLNLPQQLNCVCDTLVKKAVTNAITNGHIEGPTQILPREYAALFIWGNKITGDISGSLCFHASKSVAQKYHIQQHKKGKWTME